jgi:hypothetical protein
MSVSPPTKTLIYSTSVYEATVQGQKQLDNIRGGISLNSVSCIENLLAPTGTLTYTGISSFISIDSDTPLTILINGSLTLSLTQSLLLTCALTSIAITNNAGNTAQVKIVMGY